MNLENKLVVEALFNLFLQNNILTPYQVSNKMMDMGYRLNDIASGLKILVEMHLLHFTGVEDQESLTKLCYVLKKETFYSL